MNTKFTSTQILIFILLLFVTTISKAEIKLPALFGDGVVLQRNTQLKITGWAAAGEKVTLTFKGKKYSTKTSREGRWNLELPPQQAGGPFEMVFKGKNEITVSNVLFGDVWLCSGQSNMVLPMERVKEKFPEDIAKANYTEIRNFFISTNTNLNGPQDDLGSGSWREANPKDVLTFGALTYFFAKKIYEEYKVPIGIINASVGGTPIEAWISKEGFSDFPEVLKTIEKNQDSKYIDSLKNATKP
ncbi:MAG TPA: sialate O-acetylesterase, partial [Draconibacterium sp.]|nr:sialate O-acetylesterase [Draconibacterium sp.]